MNGRHPRRIHLFLVWRSRGALPRVLAAILALTTVLVARPAPHAMADNVCTQGSIIIDCPPAYAPPALLNLNQPLYAATSAQAASLQNLEQQAISNTIADHGLATTDGDAVESWGRDDAEAELWALLVQAIQTQPASRAVDQQNAVDWLTAAVQRNNVQAAQAAGLEYAKWAGLDQSAYQTLLAGNPSQSSLQSFLSGQVVSFNSPTTSQATGGYCIYRSPAPYATEYTGYNDQTCFTPCTNLLGCLPPTPGYDQFVKWGQADIDNAFLNSTDFGLVARDIAVGVGFGAAVVGAGVTGAALSSALAGVLVGSSLQTAIFPYLAIPLAQAAAPGALGADATAELAGGIAAGAVGFIVTVGIVALTIAIIQGIAVFTAAALPGQLATQIADAPTTTPDLGAMLDDPTQGSGLFSLFVGATLPTPLFKNCDNSLLINPAGSIAAPCLNGPAAPAPVNSDPTFGIRAPGATTTIAASISWKDAVAQTTTTAQLSGHWFVEQVSVANQPAIAVQTLRIHYTDWNGKEQTAWLLGDPLNGYHFVGLPDQSESGTPLNPSTCLAAATCSYSPTIDYVGADGNDYSAEVFPPHPPTVNPSTSANPVEGSPVTFTANGSSVFGLPLTYQWTFEQASPNGIAPICLSGCPSISGAVVSNTWTTSGTYNVQLTATDSLGKYTADTFTINVGDVQPTLALYPAATSDPSSCTLGCDVHTVALGSATALHGTITHAGSTDTENVDVNWGDGTPDDLSSSNNVTLSAGLGTQIILADTHTYAKPGSYTATVTVTDQAGGTATQSVTEAAQGAQAINFATIVTHKYGDAPFAISATGGGSGEPVTFASTTPAVCTVSGATGGTDGSGNGTGGATVTLVTAGTCTITADQAGTYNAADAAIYMPAPQVAQSFTSQKAPLTITADNQGMTYGGTQPALTWTANFVNGDTAQSLTTPPACTTVAAGSPAGSYDITCTDAADPNYTTGYAKGTLTINRGPLTITASSGTMTYGGTVPGIKASYSGLVNGDIAPATPPTCGTTATSSSPVGTYPTTCTGAADPNYSIDAGSYVAGTLKVNQAQLTIKALDQSTVYGTTAVDLTNNAGTITYDGFVNGDTATALTTQAQLHSADAKAGPAGSYPITVAGATDGNYAITFAPGTLTINRAPLTIAASSPTITYGETVPAITPSYHGFVNGDSTESLATAPSCSAAVPSSGAAGSYATKCSGAVDPNYAIDYLPGTLAIQLFTPGNLLVLSQDRAACHLLLNGGATVTAAGVLAVDGSSGSALCLNSAMLRAGSTSVQGGVLNNNSTVHGTLLTHQPVRADLLATLPAPTAPAACPGAACPDGTNLNSGHTYRLLPGTYTQAINVNSGATVCVAPGVYVLKASWTLNSATLHPYGSAGCPALPNGTTDPGVLLYFARGHVTVNGSGDLTQLRAMASGPYAGLLYWQADSESTALNGSVGFAGGAWYEPKGALILNGSTHLTAPYVAAAMITVNGGTSMNVTGS